MKLVTSFSRIPVRVGDTVRDDDGALGTIKFFRPPHKPESSGKVTIEWQSGQTSEVYVGVVGLEWIEREDRQ
jgi:hypothetical protein